MLKAIAIDDEPLAFEVLKSFTEKVTFVEMLGYFHNPFEALQFLQTNSIDFIFLDIKMPGITGIDLLKSIPDPPLVIFTTAYSEHAVESFELDAIDYLLKPFSLARFLKACNKAYEQSQLKSLKTPSSTDLPSIFIKSGYEQVRIGLSDILYAESNGNYVVFVLPDRKVLSRLTMTEAEALLPSSHFVRVHRSYIISKKHITKADKKNVWIHQAEIPIGSAYAARIEKLIN